MGRSGSNQRPRHPVKPGKERHQAQNANGTRVKHVCVSQRNAIFRWLLTQDFSLQTSRPADMMGGDSDDEE
jgi:hypothetical protein